MLSKISDQRSLFGVDVGQWPRQWATAADLLLRSRALRWLTPVVRVELTQADGCVTGWDMVHGVARPANGAAVAGIRAVELPPDQVLRRPLQLPRLGPADLYRAVGLEVAAATPFPTERTAYGFAVKEGTDNGVAVDVALTSKQEIESRLRQAALAPAGAVVPVPEIWVLPSSGVNAGKPFVPIVFEEYGGGERQRLTRRGQSVRVGLLMLALVLLGALALTPIAQLRARTIEAQQALGKLTAEAAPQLAQREQLVRQTERLQAIGRIADQQLSPLPVLDMVTRALPDSAFLTTVRIEGLKVTMNGIADDTAALVQRFGAQPGVGEIRSPSAATRINNSTKEAFNLELTLDPQVYGVLQKGAAP